MTMRQLFIGLCCGLTMTVMADPMSAPPKPEPYLRAFSPVFGYDPAYGTLLGLAWFSYPSGQIPQETARKNLNLVMRIGPHGSISYAHQQPDFSDSFGLDYALSANNFFDYETGPDSTEILSTQEQQTLSGDIRLRRALSDPLEMFAGPHIESRWQAAKNHWQGYVYGGLQRDQRDDPVNSDQGTFVQTELRWQPPALNNSQTTASWQWRNDARWFIPVRSEQTLALRALAHVGSGPALNSRLGGSEILRGYLGGQFEADTLVAGQAEYRFPFWRFIRAVGFYETALFELDEEPVQKHSAGLGLRFGLPPDQSMSVRWDLAVNDQGQWQTFVNFNQVF